MPKSTKTDQRKELRSETRRRRLTKQLLNIRNRLAIKNDVKFGRQII